MDLQLKDRHVLVTGASKGIGLEIAETFAREGARVTMVARRAEVLEARAAEISRATGASVDWIAADLGQDAGRERLFAERPGIDILVNNAGAIKGGPLEALSMEDWRAGFDLKVWGYIHLCKLYIPEMCKRRSGTVINLIGIGGRSVRPSYIIGAAGNSALIGFTSAIGAATPKDNVRVFGINPTVTKTDRMIDQLKARASHELGDAARWEELVDPSKYPFGRPTETGEIAALAVMLASTRVQYLSGTVVDIDGGQRWKA
ncbi:short-chain dehydrogenase/reductase [Seohaeicola zhoushanensis]|uniref:Short-chain dehydrogenase/reductase n=1 Tax=Seohaeicola zhoushanensis TaxID=1569283 RepID=A0A8J3GX59_9RHOB|nr:short-chain dehydrogenase/reductase [Seohaeicola zhoushanensis]GHF51938.1 short-chain dehydrogenase/reductase [Seohaeicola zhoushanensis]